MRARRLLAPVAVGAATVGALAYLALVDPNEPGHYPQCPTRWLLGIDCPGCGLLRATHALLRGDVARALDHHALVLGIWGVAIAAWLAWLAAAWSGSERQASPRAERRWSLAAIAALGVLLVFGAVRNFVPYLGSGAVGA